MASESELYLEAVLPGCEQALAPEDLAALHGYILQAGLAELQPVQPLLPPVFSDLLGKPLPRKPRAILVDVYGTLLATGLGEVAATEEAQPFTPALSPAAPAHASASAFASMSTASATALEIPGYRFPEDFTSRLHALIARDHDKAKAAGIPWPEVDAISVFMRLFGLGLAAAAKACVAWECQANPCTAMPGASDFLALCRQAQLPLGIVSNAQFYTPLFIQAAFGVDLATLGFEESLSFWSYRTGKAKPDRFMYDQAAGVLAASGIAVEDALYVGNDALNDCAAAGEAGFMTVLFAGDARSFRPRESSPRVAACPPDTVVSSWAMLAALVPSAKTDTTQRSA
jgi:putative hydrolase of the HAD superfamily